MVRTNRERVVGRTSRWRDLLTDDKLVNVTIESRVESVSSSTYCRREEQENAVDEEEKQGSYEVFSCYCEHVGEGGDMRNE